MYLYWLLIVRQLRWMALLLSLLPQFLLIFEWRSSERPLLRLSVSFGAWFSHVALGHPDPIDFPNPEKVGHYGVGLIFAATELDCERMKRNRKYLQL